MSGKKIEKIIQAAIEVRTERNLLEDSIGGGEIQWAEAMTEPVDKLVVALNQYQLDDTFNDDTPAQTFSDLEDSLPHYKCPECDTSYKLYHNRVSIERDGMCCKCFDETKAVEAVAWDMGTNEKCEPILVTVCSKCGSTVPADSVEDLALSRWAARFLKAVKGIEVSK